MTTKHYNSLAEFHAVRLQAREARELKQHRLAQRWAIIKDPHTRGILLRDALGDALRSWAPYKRVNEMLHGRVSGSTVAAVGMAVASAQQSFVRRLVFSSISMLLGKVIGQQPESSGPGLLNTVASAVGSGVRYMRERRKARHSE
ncbi:MAG: hypothetical protein IT229_13390 [Flavobacteriales bacterium]|nr:hypothetical protein [Flavobacteriales bacterium]